MSIPPLKSVELFLDAKGTKLVRGIRVEDGSAPDPYDTDLDGIVSVYEIFQSKYSQNPNGSRRSLTTAVRSELLSRLYANPAKEEQRAKVAVAAVILAGTSLGALGGLVVAGFGVSFGYSIFGGAVLGTGCGVSCSGKLNPGNENAYAYPAFDHLAVDRLLYVEGVEI